MKHSGRATAAAVARWAGLEIGSGQLDVLERYAGWLRTEALPAGGMGPAEATRLWSRHLADSLAFAKILPDPLATLVDVGSGVGLPGIPLAVALRHTKVILLDRSMKRSDLASRAVHILGLENVTVINGEPDSLLTAVEALAFRASLSIGDAARVVKRHGTRAGVGAMGLSRDQALDRTAIYDLLAAEGLVGRVIEGPTDILDSSSWLLRMESRG